MHALKDFAQSGFEWPACHHSFCVTCSCQPITNEALRFLPCKTRAEELLKINSAVCRCLCSLPFWSHISVLSCCWFICMCQHLAYNLIVFCTVNWYHSLLRYPGKWCGYQKAWYWWWSPQCCKPFEVGDTSSPCGRELSVHSIGILASLCYGRGRRQA